MASNRCYNYVVIGAGVAGCSVSYELSKRGNKNILLIDKNSGVSQGASGAAGAFLSPLLGKPNLLKELVSNALRYTTKLYQNNFNFVISNCGTTRIPKNEQDEEKFKQYVPYMDFPYIKDDKGYFFSIGTVVSSIGMCKAMSTCFSSATSKIETKFDCEIKTIEYDGEFWYLDNNIKTKKLIITTGASIDLLNQFYLNIRAVWGRRIDITTSTNLTHNYHKSCSVSKSFKIAEDKYRVSIGATHHRKYENVLDIQKENELLLQRANEIVDLKDIEIIKEYLGARACSIDYFPIVGKIIDSEKTIKDFPHLKNGTYVNKDRFTRFDNLYMLNGLGGRGFVLAPYLAKQLVDNIIDNKPLDDTITPDRLFIREVKRMK